MELKGLTVRCTSVLESEILGSGLVHWGLILSQLLLPSLIAMPSRDWGSICPRAPVLAKDPGQANSD